MERFQLYIQFPQLACGQIAAYAANKIHTAQEAAAGQAIIELHQALFHAAAMRMGKRVRGVVADRPDVAQVVVEPLQFQVKAAQIPGTARNLQTQIARRALGGFGCSRITGER